MDPELLKHLVAMAMAGGTTSVAGNPELAWERANAGHQVGDPGWYPPPVRPVNSGVAVPQAKPVDDDILARRDALVAQHDRGRLEAFRALVKSHVKASRGAAGDLHPGHWVLPYNFPP